MPTSYSETTLNIQVNRYWLAMKEEFEPIERMGENTQLIWKQTPYCTENYFQIFGINLRKLQRIIITNTEHQVINNLFLLFTYGDQPFP